MKEQIKKRLVESYSDQIFDYLISDHDQKFRYVTRFFKGAKMTLELFGYRSEFNTILTQSVTKALNRLERGYDYYRADIEYLIDFFS